MNKWLKPSELWLPIASFKIMTGYSGTEDSHWETTTKDCCKEVSDIIKFGKAVRTFQGRNMAMGITAAASESSQKTNCIQKRHTCKPLSHLDIRRKNCDVKMDNMKDS